MSELLQLSITELLDGVRARTVSAADIVGEYIARTDALNPELNAFATTGHGEALARAVELDRAIAGGALPGPLFGVPIGVKDAIDVRGMRTTMGSKLFETNLPAEDAHVIERLQAAGAVITGKLNMDEFALGVTGTNALFPPCRNPWNLDAIPGGSSSGCGSALAASLCIGALGTDTAGSIRVPASLCGAVGLKPTFGSVSRHGVIPLSWSLDHVGPMARSAHDLRHIFDVIAGFDDRDPFSRHERSEAPVPRYRPENWRIALAVDGIFAGASPDVMEAIKAAARVFESLGSDVEQRTIESPIPGGIITTEAAVLYEESLRAHPSKFSPRVQAMLRAALDRPVPAYATGRRDQVILKRVFDRVFAEFDLIVTPTTQSAAPLAAAIDQHSVARDLTRLTGPLNLVGVPALSIPCGFSAAGLPIGMQIIGPAWRDDLVIAAGESFEDATSFHLACPAVQR